MARDTVGDTALDALAATLSGQDLCETIRPASPAGAHVASARLPPSLRTVIAREDATAPLVLGPRLGEGGMGVVHVATQQALGREVAVKMLRDAGAAAAVDRLLREAWITGALEHPNVVPVHDLGRDERGRPLIVLKRIEGRAWSELLGDERARRTNGAGNATEENLAILAQLCNAIAFAHSRGIVHRDLKPENVMIGPFGEIYVVDWGIAVSLRPDPAGRMPLASDAREVAGTLAYMAPEMLAADGSIDERTDVYLLGAILYELITGAPPHLAGTVAEALAKISTTDPPYPDDASAELAAIARRAMARDRADRFPSVLALRDALLAFVRHRGSAALAEEAYARLAALEVEVAGTPRADAERRLVLHGLLAQCRFGFQQALREWPENADAREGLRRALATMAGFELDQGDPRAAALLVAEIADPPPELVARLRGAERALAQERARLDDLERIRVDRDASIGARARNVFGVGFAAALVLGSLLVAWFVEVEVTHAQALATSLAVMAALVAFAIRTRRTVMRTAINRGVVLSFIAGIGVHAALDVAAWATGVDMGTTHRVSLATWAGATCIAGVFIDRALIVAALGFVASFAVAVMVPDRTLWAVTAGLAAFAATLGYIALGSSRGSRDLSPLVDAPASRTGRTS